MINAKVYLSLCSPLNNTFWKYVFLIFVNTIHICYPFSQSHIPHPSDMEAMRLKMCKTLLGWVQNSKQRLIGDGTVSKTLASPKHSCSVGCVTIDSALISIFTWYTFIVHLFLWSICYWVEESTRSYTQAYVYPDVGQSKTFAPVYKIQASLLINFRHSCLSSGRKAFFLQGLINTHFPKNLMTYSKAKSCPQWKCRNVRVLYGTFCEAIVSMETKIKRSQMLLLLYALHHYVVLMQVS